MDLVDEEDGPLPSQLVARTRTDRTDVGDARDDAGETDEVALRGLGDNFCERRLSTARRSVENDVGQTVRLNDATQELPLSKDMLLSDDLVDRTRPHARGKRFCLRAGHSVKTYQLGMKPFTPLRIS